MTKPDQLGHFYLEGQRLGHLGHDVPKVCIGHKITLKNNKQ